jgi:hypothetical protein
MNSPWQGERREPGFIGSGFAKANLCVAGLPGRTPMEEERMNIGQAILETNEVFVDQLGLREIKNALELPWAHLTEGGKNHVSPPHPSIADVLAPEAINDFAKPFTVSAEIAEVISAMASDQSAWELCLERAALPTKTGWLEFRREGIEGSCGIYWKALGEDKFEARTYGMADQKVDHAALLEEKLGRRLSGVERSKIKALTVGGGVGYGGVMVGNFREVELFRDNSAAARDMTDDQLVVYFEQSHRFFMLFCAFLMTPHACETKWTGPSRQIRRRAGRKGLMPLLSFNEVSFCPLRNSKSAEHRHNERLGVRLHDVIAHWRRIVREGRVELSLVRAHTRGDARKGIVLKKRNIAA